MWIMDREVKVTVIRGNASSFYNNNKYLVKCYKRKSDQVRWSHVCGSMYHWVRDCANSYMNLIKKKDSVDEDINISLHSETMSYFVDKNS